MSFIPCGQGIYELWGVGWNFVSKYILLAEVKMLVMLYLYGEEFQVLATWPTAPDYLVGSAGYVPQGRHGNREGVSSTPADLKF